MQHATAVLPEPRAGMRINGPIPDAPRPRTQMPDWETSRRLNQIARRWRQFAEQRCVAYAELHETGNWKKNYAEDEFRLRMREVVNSAKRWNEIVAGFADEPIPLATAQPDPKSRHRTAA
jgi:hypothetical protein